MHREIWAKSSSARFNDLAEDEVVPFLLGLMTRKRPDDAFASVRCLAGEIILKISYGYFITHNGTDPLVDIADKAMEKFSIALRAGAWLVDSLLILRFIPSWSPGATFQRTAEGLLPRSEHIQRPRNIQPARFQDPSPSSTRTSSSSVSDATLAVFQIGKAVRDGVETDTTPGFSTGVVSHPEAFEVWLEIRDERYKGLIEGVDGGGEGDAGILRRIRIRPEGDASAWPGF
ncbi:hypothetical protein BJX68DRAFT_272205 [Aspergillus pseudodeflectus]|uniref:Uncharacterized protein n=1 Tax=Aspergillus pseudodeflectus TaxID=176178 RepID=A0ABR4JH17_9EURO